MREGPLVARVAPELAELLEASLRARGEAELAAQVAALRITRVCRCEQPYCGSFWTTARPLKRWLIRGREIELGGRGQRRVTVSVVRGEIAYVEVLFWDEVRDAVARVPEER